MLKHNKFNNFLLYSLSYIIFGAIWTCLGPMFPFLAEEENRNQTQYSFFFTCRAFGFVTGALTVGRLSSRFSLHMLLSGGIAMMGCFSSIFYFTSSLSLRGAFIFLASMGCACQDITINLAVLECFKGKDVALWLQFVHGCFGIGGLLGPFVVYLF